MTESHRGGERLDSWKAIAGYLQRDVATAARWEKGLGLPVHRVAGSGRSVFAYTSDIDGWLRTTLPRRPIDAGDVLGWEQVQWLSPERLVVAGFSGGRDGGMVALLDAAALDSGPLAMVVFPRTEVNRLGASRPNRASVRTCADGQLSLQTVEMTSTSGDACAVYELDSSLDLVSAPFNERYWDMHRSLEDQGKIAHTREECPDSDGPLEVER